MNVGTSSMLGYDCAALVGRNLESPGQVEGHCFTDIRASTLLELSEDEWLLIGHLQIHPTHNRENSQFNQDELKYF